MCAITQCFMCPPCLSLSLALLTLSLWALMSTALYDLICACNLTYARMDLTMHGMSRCIVLLHKYKSLEHVRVSVSRTAQAPPSLGNWRFRFSLFEENVHTMEGRSSRRGSVRRVGVVGTYSLRHARAVCVPRSARYGMRFFSTKC